MEFRILGPLEAREEGRRLQLGGSKQRALLALLLLHANELVPTQRLVDELWGASPPPSAAKAVQVYVSRFRKLLGRERLETRGPAYVLRVEPGELDLHRFEELLAEGRRLFDAGSPAAALGLLDEALGVWHGPALVEFDYDAFARGAITRLEELRVAASELQLETRLALGLHAEVVPELEALVREHPLRETLIRLLMLALYRGGRQADALAVYQDARRALVGGLGLEPGHALQQLERAILRQDAALLEPGDETQARKEVARPATSYARSGEVNVAYQVVGTGAFDLVYVPGAFSHVELNWTIPARASFLDRLASFSRTITFDKRGTGMSDRVGIADLETRMDDVRAVMDTAGSQRAAVLGVSEGGPMSILFAATYPERVWALILYASFPRDRWAPDYPWDETDEAWQQTVARLGEPSYYEDLADQLAPTADPASRRRFGDVMRQSGSPGARLELLTMNREIDVRDVLGSIRVPTLVLNREKDNPRNVGGSRFLAAHIPGARHVELPGAHHAPAAGDAEPVLREIETFLEQAWREAGDEREPDRVLATVLFTDIVGSTRTIAALGDRRWRELLEQHHATVRRELARFRGVEMDTTGDGFFARFDGPARAIRCAKAISAAVGELGIEVRAGLHTGECEVADGKVAGIAVSIGARVAAKASPREVLVSGTVRDLVAGSGIEFQQRGTHELTGVPGEWRLYAVCSDAPPDRT
jgi:DNA-binding SARP family transcriptional activator/class 3 adenylate cyclase